MAQPNRVANQAIARRLGKVASPAKSSGIKLQYDKKVRDFGRAGNSPGTYFSFQTAEGKRPDMGKGNYGPGVPYQEVEKRYNLVKAPTAKNGNNVDAKSQAIRRRLNGGK